MATCVECGYDGDAKGPNELVRALRTFGRGFSDRLAAIRDDVAVRTRPQPGAWSALEYVAHTRDAIAWYGERIARILTQDRPQLTARDWDAICEERRYIDEVPAA